MLGFLLDWPWSLLDPPSRRPLGGTGVARLDPMGALMIAAPADLELRVRRGRAHLEAEGPSFLWEGKRFHLYALPAPRTAQESEIVLAGDTVLQAEQVLHHTEATASSGPAGPEITADEATSALIDTLVGLIAMLLDAAPERALGPRRLRWDDVAELWLGQRPTVADPRRALVARHAEELEALLVSLAERPRRVLERVRRLTPIHRVQELDRACIGWYVRQPGSGLAEKAGPRQRVQSVVREESRDTLENRVLREMLRLSARAARRYVDANRRFAGRPRLERVKRYGAICRRLLGGPELAGLRPLPSVPMPNYPLLFNPGYRRVWTAYRELLREDQAVDEAWRWQRRLWADVVRLAVLAALTRTNVEHAEPSSVAAASPLELRDEQARGRWSWPTPCGAVLLHGAPAEIVVEVLDPSGLAAPQGHEEVPDALLALGASLLLRLERLVDGRIAWIAVWAVWPPRDGGSETMLASASRAVAGCRTRLEEELDPPPALAGLVVTVRADEKTDFYDREQVWALEMPLTERGFEHGVYLVRGIFDELVAKRLFPA